MSGPRDNRLLAALPEEAYGALVPFLERVELPLDAVVYESGGPRRHMYFPISGIVSLQHVLDNGDTMEFAMTGNEGMVGFPVFMSDDPAPHRVVVHVAGSAYRIGANILNREFERSAPLRRILLRHAQALIAQMAQTAVCNRHHALGQRLCRLLLMARDRLPSNDLAMAQERIAGMLGVRRVGVTEAVGALRAAGLIGHRRGLIIVLDRRGLEKRACECYQRIKKEYDRMAR